jgi:hypothetical protein
MNILTDAYSLSSDPSSLDGVTTTSVGFSPVDGTPTNLGVLKQILAVVTSAGGNRFYIIWV